jgi:hypothetical protein
VIAAAECDQLVVGQEYLVPCINGTPVVGTPHVDNDHFNVTEDHYHCDSRFSTDPLGAFCAMRNLPTINRGSLEVYDPHATRKLEARVCIRDTPLPFSGGRFGIALMSLYADYGFTTANCGLCPHKGMPIQNGRCSGHRLEWLPDGTIKYKPPYILRLRGSGNVIRIDERVELNEITFYIVESIEGQIVVEMEDRDGHVFVSQATDHYQVRIGDRITYRR